jgi:hypothetical protein
MVLSGSASQSSKRGRFFSLCDNRMGSSCAKAADSNPLDDAVILQQVLSFAGAGEWSFYAPVSKLWLQCYRATSSYRLKRLVAGGDQFVEVLPHMTLRRAVLASVARVKQAHDLGLRFGNDNDDMQFYSGFVASRVVLDAARRLGMLFSTDMLNGVAYSGNLSTVIWLHRQHKCDPNSVTSTCCARRGHIHVLRWLQQQGKAVLSANTMLFAALHGQKLTCAYLHAVGCDWDAVAAYAAAKTGHPGTHSAGYMSTAVHVSLNRLASKQQNKVA